MIKIIIRDVQKKDLLDIFAWRKDKLANFFSKNKNKITLQSHKKWFYKALLNPKKFFYVCYLLNKNSGIIKKIGYVIFDIKNRFAIVSINLNPAFRKKNLSTILLSKAIKKFYKFKKLKLLAEIKKDNLASLKCFFNNKFHYLKKSKNDFNFYQKPLH
jgi:RimJ/RimL family protein N-acetyltransferase